MGLDLVFGIGDGVQGPIETVERRGVATLGQGGVGPEPVGDTAPL
jgi:hypothetical protein